MDTGMVKTDNLRPVDRTLKAPSNRAILRAPRLPVAGVILLFACSCSMLTSPDAVPFVYEETIKAEWGIAVERLELAGVERHRLESIQWHDFSWHDSQGQVDCGGVAAYACYGTSPPTITWWVDYPQAIRHEIGHGILHQLEYECWKDWEHKDKDGNARNGGCPK